MSVLVAGVITSAAVGVYSADQQRSAANRASRAQSRANDAALEEQKRQFDLTLENSNAQHAASLALQRHIAGMQIGEQRRQFDVVRKTLAPFIKSGKDAISDLAQYQTAGSDALAGQRDLIGLNGTDAQSAAIQGLSNSPEMAAYIQQGENAMLQNAAATGGLRGGNNQAAIAQFRPSLLAGMINTQYERLGGLTSLGANVSSNLANMGASSAAGQASAAMQVAGNVGSALSGYASGAANSYANLMAQQNAAYGNMAGAYSNYYNTQGSIAAGNALAQGNANAAAANSISSALGSYTMMNMLNGGGTSGTTGTYGTGMSNYGNMQTTNYGLSGGRLSAF